MRTPISILFLLLLLSAAAAQEPYSLRRCIEVSLERNYAIRIIRNQEEISSNNATLGNAGYLPTADLSASASGSITSTTSSLTDGTTESSGAVRTENASAGLSVSWTVFDGFGIQAEYARLTQLKSMGELNTRLTIEDLIASIAGEYYNLIRQKTRLNNLVSTLNLSRERLRIVEERYAIGSMSRLDLRQAQVDFNADSSAVLNQLESLHRARTNLNRTMALDNVETPVNLRDSIITPNRFLDEAQLWSSVLENNISLLIARKNVLLSEIDLKKAKSRNYPYLRLNAGYTYAATGYHTGATDLQQRLGPTYGLTVGYPLFDGFNRKREQKNASITIQNRTLQRQDLELTLRADMSNQWMAYDNNLQLLDLEKANLVAAQENYAIALERYRLGQLSGIQLREAQLSLLNAEERQSIAEYAIKLCEISLLQLSGQITSALFSDRE
jgi:outer membrane protein TolC